MRRSLLLPLACALLLTPSVAAPPPPPPPLKVNPKINQAAERLGQQSLAIDARRQIVTEGSILHVESLTEPGIYLDIPIEALRLINPYARQTALGVRIGSFARIYGKQRPSNRQFYHNSRIACAAYVSYVLRKAGWKHGSNGATALYGLTRKYGGRLVGTNISTRHVRFYPYLQAGDCIFFIQGGRIRHTEIYIGGGLCSGTSSSMGRVGIRAIGNRGFRAFSVVRL